MWDKRLKLRWFILYTDGRANGSAQPWPITYVTIVAAKQWISHTDLVNPVFTVTPSAFNCHETAFALWFTVWDLDLTSCMSCVHSAATLLASAKMLEA
ncbi:hypothetical protein NC653_040053 [Populus alba x Populus x berolinensis]|uniref:Uncharacterized protein n=1 Tax=Populus alba x Populus x berolinensis TaxID=444605 RepID=A0AAD6PR66_9ROSI|nr:hypothetical protein NC653_040040 [Populus alba x Populus x berolinensis]KAJ6958287.1 hypothetical protein NC653_040053 [Populus alba x Populus x berolinensis]